jgi:hypothetical protein
MPPVNLLKLALLHLQLNPYKNGTKGVKGFSYLCLFVPDYSEGYISEDSATKILKRAGKQATQNVFHSHITLEINRIPSRHPHNFFAFFVKERIDFRVFTVLYSFYRGYSDT